jgi:hypothetical protein
MYDFVNALGPFIPSLYWSWCELQIQVYHAIAILPKSTVVQYYVADFSFWTLAFLCNSVVSLSALFFWNQLTALKWGMAVHDCSGVREKIQSSGIIFTIVNEHKVLLYVNFARND